MSLKRCKNDVHLVGRNILKNESTGPAIGIDTAENGPLKGRRQKSQPRARTDFLEIHSLLGGHRSVHRKCIEGAQMHQCPLCRTPVRQRSAAQLSVTLGRQRPVKFAQYVNHTITFLKFPFFRQRNIIIFLRRCQISQAFPVYFSFL